MNVSQRSNESKLATISSNCDIRSCWKLTITLLMTKVSFHTARDEGIIKLLYFIKKTTWIKQTTLRLDSKKQLAQVLKGNGIKMEEWAGK